MNDFFLAPLLSLFSLKFYRRVILKSVSFGFSYLGYLSAIFALSSLVMFAAISIPVADELAKWFASNLPEMTFTRQGVQMGINQPVLLSHPRWGPILYLDPANDSPQPQDMNQALLVIARTQVAYQNPSGGGYRLQKITPPPNQKEWHDLRINNGILNMFWTRVRPFLYPLSFVVAFLAAFFWKLAAGLFYSLIGLILNRFRNQKLNYGAILNLSILALTPVALLQIAGFTTPLHVPTNFGVTLVVTTLYLTLGILGTRDRKAPKPL